MAQAQENGRQDLRQLAEELLDEGDHVTAKAVLRRATIEDRARARYAQQRQQQRGGADSVGEVMKGLKELFERAGVVEREATATDLEGTPVPMADRRGGFAKDARQAKRGGPGIVDSNTDPKAPDASFGQGAGHEPGTVGEDADPTKNEEYQAKMREAMRLPPGRERDKVIEGGAAETGHKGAQGGAGGASGGQGKK